ncbi:hypothetical protein HJFPF1_01937 [Paramyrothecium foliicola]|nr:hypothetical protein HJFPF1_01937 [Paramyrothecium foliicola]
MEGGLGNTPRVIRCGDEDTLTHVPYAPPRHELQGMAQGAWVQKPWRLCRTELRFSRLKLQLGLKRLATKTDMPSGFPCGIQNAAWHST